MTNKTPKDAHDPLHVDVLVIGGGFSGSIVSCQLVQRGLRVALVQDRKDLLARGIAYHADQPHLLNVRAGRMSALSDKPDHFVQYLQSTTPGSDAATFAPRATYGAYLQKTLEDHTRTFADALTVIEGTAEQLVPHTTPHAARTAHWQALVRTPQGEQRAVSAEFVVLATGNMPNTQLRRKDGVAQPSARAIELALHPLPDGVRREDHVLLVGSGLTAIDFLQRLELAGHDGPVSVVSRHGFAPVGHHEQIWVDSVSRPSELAPPGSDGSISVEAIARWIATTSAELCDKNLPPYLSVDALRPTTVGLWQRLSPKEQATFLQEWAPLWNTIRHRAAPQSMRAWRKRERDGKLKHRRGTFVGYAEANGRLSVTITDSTGVDLQIACDWIVNCTGPSRDVQRSARALDQQLLRDGIVVQDPHKLGIRTEHGHVVQEDGTPHRHLLAIGPLRLAAEWETVAVPELSRQALELATLIANETTARSASRQASLRLANSVGGDAPI